MIKKLEKKDLNKFSQNKFIILSWTIKKENLISREISESLSNKRLDIVLAETFPEYSQKQIKKMARK